MTLIVNEIHFDPRNSNSCRIVSAADRRIRIGSNICEKRKLFYVERLNVTISYFGLAGMIPGTSFEELLDEFVNADRSTSLSEFAAALWKRLNNTLRKEVLQQHPSGFHVCGFNNKVVPEMWYITNIGGMEGFTYTTFRDHYAKPSEELSTVHLTALFDSTTGSYKGPFAFSFQNGDLRIFRPAWDLLDTLAASMDVIGLSRRAQSPFEHEARLKWKMSTIALFCETISYERIIGGPIDIITLLPNR
jgi:hypothetical protein